LLEATRRDAETVVRTARNHISNVSYDETYKALGVAEVRWSSQLDGRTSKVCAARDGMRWNIGEPHPVPPAHPNCRSVLVPAIDVEVMGNRPYVRAMKVTGKDGKTGYRSIGDMTKKQREAAGLKVG